MAKAPKSSVADLAADLVSGIGENHDAQAVKNFIDTGYPPLNFALSGRYDGGLPFGRLVEMFGESSTGKTALSTEWMIQAQKMGGVAIFCDWERFFDVGMAEAMGLNTQRPYWVYIRPRTWEEGNILVSQAVEIIRKSGAISADAPILAVFDSIASAIPASASEKSLDTLTMNDTTALARVTSTTLKYQARFAAENEATYLYLNQIRLKVGVVFGDPRTTPGGKAMEYYATCRVALGRSKIMEDEIFVGQNITAQVTKSKLTAPYKECTLRMSFDEIGAASFDPVASMVETLIEKKIIPKPGGKSGKTYMWTDGKQYAKKALIEYCRDHVSIYTLMELYEGKTAITV